MAFLLIALCLASVGVNALENPMSSFGRFRHLMSKTPVFHQTEGRVPRLPDLPNDLTKLYPTQNFTVAVDHFHNDSRYEPHSDETFQMRYWFDASFYKEGGPVICLYAGETSATNRLPFLQKGIVYELAKATHGVGVVLEHRYYGESWPVSNLSTESLRFLTTDQAMADSAVFAENIVFPGLEEYNLTSSATPWIAYGGSYAGVFVSFLRALYPETFFGAISSSGVTAAIIDYWEYNQPIIDYGPTKCIHNVRVLTNVMDNIATIPSNQKYIHKLQKAFGLEGISHVQDFMELLWGEGVGQWQGRNWDPKLDNPGFLKYCGQMESEEDIYNLTATKGAAVEELLHAAGYGGADETLKTPMLNWIGWTYEHGVKDCARMNLTQDDCFSTFNATVFAKDDMEQEWRAWPYQFCTEWGYHITGSGAPAEHLPLISRTIDLEFKSKLCEYAFNITTPPDIERINKLGGLKFKYPRVAVVVGKEDVWRPATPLAEAAQPWPEDTLSEPVILIEGAGHHWDENGRFPNETTKDLPPPPVASAQKQEVEFVLEWLKEYKKDTTAIQSIPVGQYVIGNELR